MNLGYANPLYFLNPNIPGRAFYGSKMDINKHLERAQEAVRKKNFEYAISLYNQVLAVKPDNGRARAELRQAALRKSEYRGASGILLKIQALPHYLGILLALVTKNKDGVIRSCERFLQANPTSPGVNFLLGKKLEEAGHLNSAVAVFEFLGEIDKTNTMALKRAGYIKYQNHDLQGAMDLYERVLALNPRDAEAEKMRKNLAAEGTLASGSYTTARSSREMIKEKEEAAHLQRQTRIHKTEEEIEADILHFKKALEEEPKDKRALRALGDLYLRKKDYASARDHYSEMLKLDPDSYEVRCGLGDIEIKAYTDEIEKLEERLHKEDKENLKEDLDALKKELLSKQVEEYAWRVKAHPTDLGLWFQYGLYVFKARKTDEAIEAFQHAVKDPRHKIQSLHMLGRAFFAKGLLDLAKKQLEGALEASGGLSEKSKDIVYDLGKVAEKKGNSREAMDWYLKIFEIDINYKDVAKKIETIKKEM